MAAYAAKPSSASESDLSSPRRDRSGTRNRTRENSPGETLVSPGSRESSGAPCGCSVRVRPQCAHTITGIYFIMARSGTRAGGTVKLQKYIHPNPSVGAHMQRVWRTAWNVPHLVTLVAPVGDDVPMEVQIRHVSIHGHDMAYSMEGSGPALLLLHGIAGSSRTWRDVIPFLKDRFTVIAPDLMGHGLAEKPVGDYSLGAFASGIRDLLEVLDIERASVVGQSFGGGVAMQLAYQHPELCDRLVLVDSGGLGREVNWMLRFMTLPGSEYLMPLIFPRFVRDWGDSLFRFTND